MLEAEQTFTAEELGLETLNQHLLIQVGPSYDENGMTVDPLKSVYVEVIVYEGLAFHRALEGTNRQYFDDEGRLTIQALYGLSDLIHSRYGAEDYTVEFEIDGEEPTVQFSVGLDVPTDTKVEDLGAILWEKTTLVKFSNEADPGTFGTQYLFGSLLADTIKELSEREDRDRRVWP